MNEQAGAIALTFFVLIFPVFGDGFSAAPEMGEWQGLPWGTSLEEVKSVWGLTGEKKIVSHDERKVVMKSHTNLTLKQELFGEPAELSFDFAIDRGLSAVTAEFFGDVESNDLLSRLENWYGTYGKKPLLSMSGDKVVGTSCLWVRAYGELLLESSENYLWLSWHEKPVSSFPPPLFQAIESGDLTELQFLIDAGVDLNDSYPIFEDEQGEVREATALDYALQLALINPDSEIYHQAVSLLKGVEAPVLFFPGRILDRFK